jgi:cobalt-zinc-cadmium efflux system outer membrane protein
MNRSMDHELTAIDRLTFVSTTIDREQLRNLAQTQRPEIASVQAIKDASKLEARAIQIKNSPDIAVQARTETFDSNTNCGIALVVSLPIFDWGSVKADKKQAEITTQSHEKRLESVENDISLDLEQAIIQVETSSQIVREYQGGILDKSDELAQMAQTGYEKGATSYLEVLEAQRTLRNIKTEYYTALADHAKSIAQLEWATGSGLTNTTATEVKK